MEWGRHGELLYLPPTSTTVQIIVSATLGA